MTYMYTRESYTYTNVTPGKILYLRYCLNILISALHLPIRLAVSKTELDATSGSKHNMHESCLQRANFELLQ